MTFTVLSERLLGSLNMKEMGAKGFSQSHLPTINSFSFQPQLSFHFFFHPFNRCTKKARLTRQSLTKLLATGEIFSSSMKAAGSDSYHGSGNDVFVSLCRSLSFTLFAYYNYQFSMSVQTGPSKKKRKIIRENLSL